MTDTIQEAAQSVSNVAGEIQTAAAVVGAVVPQAEEVAALATAVKSVAALASGVADTVEAAAPQIKAQLEPAHGILAEIEALFAKFTSHLHL